jgi:hypothetical protein
MLSTVAVFGILGLSAIPVLKAIGQTVAIGVFTSFGMALVIAQPTFNSTSRFGPDLTTLKKLSNLGPDLTTLKKLSNLSGQSK